MIRITVMGDAIPAARPRFGGRRVYQPKKNTEYRARVQYATKLAMAGRLPMTGAVSAVVKLYRRYKPTTCLYGDVDNHLKALFDGMNGLAIEDDRQITRCLVEKFQDKDNPRAEIELHEIE